MASRSARRARLSDRERSQSPAPHAPLLTPEAQRGIVIVTLLTLAAVMFLSVLGGAGFLGQGISNGLGMLFGWQRYIIPLYLAVIGLLLLFPERFFFSRTRWFGLVVWLLASEALLHLSVATPQAFPAALQGEGGGYLGALISYPLRVALGSWASGLILFGGLVASALLMFNTSLRSLARPGSWFSHWLNRRQTARWQRRLVNEQSSAAEPTFATQTLASESPADEEADSEHQVLKPQPARRHRRPRRDIAIPLDLLESTSSQPTSGNIEANKEKIQRTLENFGISVAMGEVNVGPTVTQYTLKPAEGVKLSQITSLNNDLALTLAAHPIRIEAPIPGKSLVGVEVPNQSVAIVQLREIIASANWQQRHSNLSFALGKDVSGQPWVADLDPLPHLLVAGATGSGKSVLINDLIISLLYCNSPDDLKFILVDPKRVELTAYNGIPHLLTPVITDTTKTINALRWIVSEMDRRYNLLSQSGKRNLATYRTEVSDDVPYVVLIIDELADLMSVAANEVEGAIVRLAQMARAVGIHLVLATQRPSVDVITGLIKANVTARVAFSVAAQVDSRTILDVSGAEKLLGRGDMLYQSAELSKPKRLQAPYVSEREVERVVQYLKSRGQPEYLGDVVEKPEPQIGGSLEDLGDDELLPQAKEVILQADKASASLLQRRLRIGYARAARILDLLEEEGFIGPGEGAKPREVMGDTPPTGPTQPEDASTDPPRPPPPASQQP
ncbi:MAG: DNA translocase FtsK 4TM domain-containing protein [Candidatus Kerfeldbacteria bacterium]|nr:DNA translocase FtsK 4TM domain-containing protein [Candidatus Kerfeldbacteria bacterium]